MLTISEERDALEKLLRSVCRVTNPLPVDVQEWWDAEKIKIAAEKAAKDARNAEKISSLQTKIAELQAQLDDLT